MSEPIMQENQIVCVKLFEGKENFSNMETIEKLETILNNCGAKEYHKILCVNPGGVDIFYGAIDATPEMLKCLKNNGMELITEDALYNEYEVHPVQFESEESGCVIS